MNLKTILVGLYRRRTVSPYVKVGPQTVQIETTTRCNLQCEKCERNLGNLPVQDMTIDTFQKILKRIGHVKNLFPFGRGEPLLHPELEPIITVAKEYADMVSINTNGVLLSPDIARSLARAGLSKLVVSLDDLHNKQVVQNVSDTVVELTTRGVVDVPLSLHAVLSRKNERSILEVPPFAAAQGIKNVTFNVIKFHRELLPTDTRGTITALNQQCRRYGLETNLDRLMTEKHNVNFCHAPFKSCFVDVEGNMTPCCNYPHGKVGNVLSRGAWNSPQFQQFRNQWINGKIPDWCENYCLPARRALRGTLT